MGGITLLIIGDTHIPDRAHVIPQRLLNTINEYKPYDIVVHTGDFTHEDVYKWVKSLGYEVYAVEGNMDWLSLPASEYFDLGDFKVGIIHGDQVFPRGDVRKLTKIAKRLGVNVLISGHTHLPYITKHGNIHHINPGSLTGVWGGGGGSMKPSLIIAKYEKPKLELVLYELDVGLDKVEVSKFIISP